MPGGDSFAADTQIRLRCPPEDALDPWVPTEWSVKTLIRLRE